MAVTIHFDYGSPYAYLAWQRLRRYPERYEGVDVEWVPVSAGHIFAQDGTRPNVTYPNQKRYLEHDVRRWADLYGVPFAPPADGEPGAMPVNAIHAMRLHLLAVDEGKATDWMEAAYLGSFRDGLDISDPGVLDRLASDVGLSRGSEAAQDAALKARLVANTKEAYAAGAPGVPYTVLDGEGFWGNDRLAWVEARLAKQEVPASL